MEWIFLGIALVPVAFVWYVNGGGIYHAIKKTRTKVMDRLTCSIDADCPDGFICIDGQCQPAS